MREGQAQTDKPLSPGVVSLIFCGCVALFLLIPAIALVSSDAKKSNQVKSSQANTIITETEYDILSEYVDTDDYTDESEILLSDTESFSHAYESQDKSKFNTGDSSANDSSNIPSVMGIEFGSTYDDVKALLQERLGSTNIFEKSGKLWFTDVYLGDFKFNSGELGFQFKGHRSWFNQAWFIRWWKGNETQQAKQSRDYLYSLIKDKYEDDYLDEYINEFGFKCYKFGVNPIDDTRVLGTISLTRIKGGLYLVLEYLPIYYLDKGADF